MKHGKMLVTVCAMSLASFLSVHAAETYKVYNTGGFTPKIDANLGDWAMVKTSVKMDKFTEFDGGKWNGKDDCSGTLKLLWSDKGLYVAVEVTDDEHINTMIGDQIWNGDSTQVMIDPTGERQPGNGVDYEYNFGLGGAKSDAPQFSRARANLAAKPDIFAEYSFKRDEAAKKTYYEVLFTKSDITPATMKAGSKMGFAVIVNDGDKGQEGQKGWIGWAENAIVFGKKPEQTNIIELLGDALAVDLNGKLAVSWGELKR